jgi:hypothetical protein
LAEGYSASARISGDEKQIILLEKHYSFTEYMSILHKPVLRMPNPITDFSGNNVAIILFSTWDHFKWNGFLTGLFLTGYGQRSRTSFFNTCIKKNFWILTNKWGNKLKHEIEAKGPGPIFKYLLP